jgi:2-amino-4-hydroxy-6-hydroxymethyldihydropteridine diphosphokinase
MSFETFLGLGSNMGDRLGYLDLAVSVLSDLDPDLTVSPVYETEPIGGPEGQGKYLNCVVRLVSDLSAHQLLDIAHALEELVGRVRTVRNGPRPLDVDILLVGDAQISEPDLQVPHPRMFERGFVLAPLEDLDPSRVPAGWRDRLAETDPGAVAVLMVGRLPSH